MLVSEDSYFLLPKIGSQTIQKTVKDEDRKYHQQIKIADFLSNCMILIDLH